jgi:transcriptional regulator with XRE-family HTH domain
MTSIRMDFGVKIIQLRKEKGLTRDKLGKLIGTSAPIVGMYERNEMKPSVEIAAKIAEALAVSLDYLVGNSNIFVKDKKILNRIENIASMPDQQQRELFNVVDAYLRDFKAKQAYNLNH